MRRPPTAVAWRWILTCFALVLLSCAAKNYLAVAVRDTALCPYLCPSLLGRDWLVFSLPVLEQLFAWQHALQDALQGMVRRYWSDPTGLATTLLIAPVLEEAIYRGPLYLARGRLRSGLWWLLGLLLALAFALSHGRGGLAMAPLLMLAVCGLWLIAATQRLWPSVALHMLYNAFLTSITVQQSLWAAD
jgi:membrane protease YdiL (CAAX protease family)